MLDKDKPTNQTPEESTNDKKVLVVDSSAPNNKKANSSNNTNDADQTKTTSSKAQSKAKPTNKSSSTASSTTHKNQQKVSKLAILALIIASAGIASTAGHYFWLQQQSSVNEAALHKATEQALQSHKQQLESSLNADFSAKMDVQLNKQQQAFNAQLLQYAEQSEQISQSNQENIAQLNQKLNVLEQSVSQRDPSDWLLHEAEYLIRMAARTMWLEQDTRAAIGLLKEADKQLETLQQPKYLPVRALIHQDIEALALMPALTNHEAVLSLMALNKQIPTLPLAGVNLAEALEGSEQENLELSEDIGDWQSNLSKTWNKFLSDFITVRRRTGNVEPLMAPEQQQHLKQNLSLKIQLAQWAASEQKNDIYQQTLKDIQTWLNEFFDMEATVNKNFYQALEQAKQHVISYNYPSDLASLGALKSLIKQQTTSPTNKAATNKASDAEVEADTVTDSSGNTEPETQTTATTSEGNL